MRANAAVLVGTLIAFSACEGGDRDLPAKYRALEVPIARLRAPAARARGRALFVQNCVLCHGEHGAGDGVRQTGFARPPRNLRDPGWQQTATPRRVFAAIREGVPASGMPAWVALDDDETWDLVAYVLSLGEGVAS
jgi:mono/diheme cytochrome c family protein